MPRGEHPSHFSMPIGQKFLTAALPTELHGDCPHGRPRTCALPPITPANRSTLPLHFTPGDAWPALSRGRTRLSGPRLVKIIRATPLERASFPLVGSRSTEPSTYLAIERSDRWGHPDSNCARFARSRCRGSHLPRRVRALSIRICRLASANN
jgi:hypothetical protein